MGGDFSTAFSLFLTYFINLQYFTIEEPTWEALLGPKNQVYVVF